MKVPEGTEHPRKTLFETEVADVNETEVPRLSQARYAGGNIDEGGVGLHKDR
jgi:hypothetical protein